MSRALRRLAAATDPASLGRRHGITLEGLSNAAVEQARPRDGLGAIALPDAVGGLDGAPLTGVGGLEEGELLPASEVRGAHTQQADGLAAHLGCRKIDRDAPDRLGQVGRLVDGALSSDRLEASVAHLDS